MMSDMTADLAGVPSFARIEITLSGRDGLPVIADELRRLATELEETGQANADPAAMIVAYHKIKATSKKLRNGH